MLFELQKSHDEVHAMSPEERSAYFRAVIAYTQQEPERWTMEAYLKVRAEYIERTGEKPIPSGPYKTKEDIERGLAEGKLIRAEDAIARERKAG
jgi:hypothetical protein